MIVVLPFENLGSTENDYFAAGITDEMTSRLAAVDSLGVIYRTSAVQYDRTGKTMAQIGRDLTGLGRREETIRAGRRGVELYPVSVDALHGPDQLVTLARIYTKLGDHDEVIDLIAQLPEMPAGLTASQLEIEPWWAPLRGEPRYARLIDAEEAT